MPSFNDVTSGRFFDELDPEDQETIRYSCEDSDKALQLYYLFNAWFDRYLPRHRWIVENIESPTSVYLGIMNNDFRFSETQVNRTELQQYREESDSVLSFVKEYCELDPSAATGSTELFRAYKSYCDECGLKPYSQKTFVQQLLSACSDVERDIDRLGGRRVLNGIKLGEMLG